MNNFNKRTVIQGDWGPGGKTKAMLDRIPGVSAILSSFSFAFCSGVMMNIREVSPNHQTPKTLDNFPFQCVFIFLFWAMV